MNIRHIQRSRRFYGRWSRKNSLTLWRSAGNLKCAHVSVRVFLHNDSGLPDRALEQCMNIILGRVSLKFSFTGLYFLLEVLKLFGILRWNVTEREIAPYLFK